MTTRTKTASEVRVSSPSGGRNATAGSLGPVLPAPSGEGARETRQKLDEARRRAEPREEAAIAIDTPSTWRRRHEEGWSEFAVTSGARDAPPPGEGWSGSRERRWASSGPREGGGGPDGGGDPPDGDDHDDERDGDEPGIGGDPAQQGPIVPLSFRVGNLVARVPKLPDKLPSDIGARLQECATWLRKIKGFLKATFPMQDMGRRISELASETSRGYVQAYTAAPAEQQIVMSLDMLEGRVPVMQPKQIEYMATVLPIIVDRVGTTIEERLTALDVEHHSVTVEFIGVFIAVRLELDVSNAAELDALESKCKWPKAKSLPELTDWWVLVQHLETLGHVTWRHVAKGVLQLLEKWCRSDFGLSEQQRFDLRMRIGQLGLGKLGVDRESVAQAYACLRWAIQQLPQRERSNKLRANQALADALEGIGLDFGDTQDGGSADGGEGPSDGGDDGEENPEGNLAVALAAALKRKKGTGKGPQTKQVRKEAFEALAEALVAFGKGGKGKNKGSEAINKNECFKCGSREHWARDCPKAKPVCRLFKAEGKCSYGDKCIFEHVAHVAQEGAESGNRPAHTTP